MNFFGRMKTAFNQRSKRSLDELSDWIIAPLGALCFLIAGYWGMVVADVLPDLVKLVNQQGLTWSRTAALVFLGGLGLTIWLFTLIAVRCHNLLVKRHPL